MKCLLILTLSLAIFAATDHQANADSIDKSSETSSVTFAGRKSVTVSADSAAEAFAQANRRHPGWSAIKAKKTGSGRFWQVTMVKP